MADGPPIGMAEAAQCISGLRRCCWRTSPLAIVASEVGNLASELVTALGIDLLESLRESNSELFSDFVHQSWWLVFIGGCVLPGLGEEIYCRGFMGRGLVARYGVLLGSIATSLLFGAMHLEPVQATSAFVLGLGLHYLFLLTRSLPTAVVLHTLNNFSAFLVMRYEDSLHIPGLTAAPDGSIEHTPPWLLAAALAAALALGSLLYQTRTRWLLPDGSLWSPGYVTGEGPPREVTAQATSPTPQRPPRPHHAGGLRAAHGRRSDGPSSRPTTALGRCHILRSGVSSAVRLRE